MRPCTPIRPTFDMHASLTGPGRSRKVTATYNGSWARAVGALRAK